MKTSKFTFSKAKIAGSFFIIAAISSIIGLKLYDPILNDENFIRAAAGHEQQIVFGAILELILVITASGTGIVFFVQFRKIHESLGLAYLCFRLLEVIFIVIGMISVLAALSISQDFRQGLLQKDTAESLMRSYIAVHKWTFILGPNFMLAINTFLYSFAFLKNRMIPLNLARLGLVSSLLIMIAAILELFAFIEQISVWGILLALPIALYEMMLAIRLLAKGFNRKI